MPRLRILAGPSPRELSPISANTGKGYIIKTPRFEGELTVYLKDFINEDGQSPKTKYFESEGREGATWSIQARGRFLKEYSADDVLFGNVFDRPLNLPHGSKAAIKFMQYLDTTLEEDLYSDKPWALSPLITTMPFLSITEASSSSPSTSSSPQTAIQENSSILLPPSSSASPDIDLASRSLKKPRHTHFHTPEARQESKFTPSHHVEMDFCHSLLSFADGGLSVSFPIPVHPVSFDLMRYWDGRPVWFVCCERGKDGKGPGEMIWCVGFEILDDTA